MNEQANTKLVQDMYAAFGRGDIQTILDHLASDVEWVLDGPSTIPFAGKRKGPVQVRGFFEALGGTQQDQKLTITDYIAQGDNVATVGRYSAKVKETGRQMDSAVAHIFTIRDGKVTRFLDFGDTAHMAEAYKPKTATAR
jgi:ketosteroid isomerase-like protein